MSPPERSIDLWTDILHHRAAGRRDSPERRWGYARGMGVIYKPFGIILGIAAGLLGKRIFNFVWTKIDDEDPPKATTEQTSWAKLLSSAAIQGVIFKLTRVVVDRYGAVGFSYLTGTWPGEKRPDPDE
jgi:hypothetical protein